MYATVGNFFLLSIHLISSHLISSHLANICSINEYNGKIGPRAQYSSKMNGQNVYNNSSQGGSVNNNPLQPTLQTTQMQYYPMPQMNQPNQYGVPAMQHAPMGMNYGTHHPFYPNPHQYQQGWYGFTQAQPPYVDVTKSSKINYDDEEEEEEEVIEHQQSNLEAKDKMKVPEKDPIKKFANTNLKNSAVVENKIASDEEDKGKEEEEEEEEEASADEDIIETVKGSDVYIPGTSIVLKTEEDIAKWKEERRKMWLIKISNKKEMYREKFNIKDEDLNRNPLQESRKERYFIQNIQNQVKRFNHKPNLTVGLHQRILKEENGKILEFIKELGDANYLKYELTEEEKEVLFGGKDHKNDQNRRSNRRYDRQLNPRDTQYRNHSRKRPIDEV
ncbi:Rsa1 [Kluyveromyces lactis]|nr:Rsa1 [Kluyveromyces lactis]